MLRGCDELIDVSEKVVRRLNFVTRRRFLFIECDQRFFAVG